MEDLQTFNKESRGAKIPIFGYFPAENDPNILMVELNQEASGKEIIQKMAVKGYKPITAEEVGQNLSRLKFLRHPAVEPIDNSEKIYQKGLAFLFSKN